jgi:uncharacterized protein
MYKKKFKSETIEISSKWQRADHLYYINDIIKNNTVVIDSLFNILDIVNNSHIKTNNKNTMINIANRYSDPFSSEGRKTIEEKYKAQFVDKPKRKVCYFSLCPSFSCNLACTYCFEEDYNIKHKKVINRENLKIALEKIKIEILRIREKEPETDIKLELFGGEPIQRSNISIVEIYLNFAREQKCSVSIVTNGYELRDHVLTLIKYRDVISQISLTLDGPENIHNSMRVTQNNKGSFEKITEAIDLYLRLKINVSVATNVCRENINSLKDLFEFYYKKNWINYPNFTAYIGQVASRTSKKIKSNVLYEGEILEKILKIFPDKKSKWLKASFLKITEQIASSLGVSFGQNEYGKAKYHYCWSSSPIYCGYYFGPNLETYRCVVSVGNQKYSLGDIRNVNYKSFSSSIFNRNIFSNKDCLTCNIGGFCSGGCVLERLCRGKQMCQYEHNCFEDFVNRIVKSQLKNLLSNKEFVTK